MIRLPTLRRDLKLGYRSDAELRRLCEDYEDAQQALDLRQRSMAKATAESSEYALLISDLEADIRRHLSNPSAPPAIEEPTTWRTGARRLLGWIRRLTGAERGRNGPRE
jgi:hypothetical protein